MDTRLSGDVIVVGGGVIGLATAVVLAERGLRVRVWTRDPVERTTSAVAGALWWPYHIEPMARARVWALRSLEIYEELAERPGETGVRLVDGILGETELEEVEGWAAADDLRRPQRLEGVPQQALPLRSADVGRPHPP
ncbi:FAD-dependent oxidoreductase, partial [Streptomyces sp. NPDC052127]|uniref:FAD-dependent oxidoreductase n=1 Tax=Streptomyces sp. NPDC052127 TaxID=3155679 RepID=UPI00341DA267